MSIVKEFYQPSKFRCNGRVSLGTNEVQCLVCFERFRFGQVRSDNGDTAAAPCPTMDDDPLPPAEKLFQGEDRVSESNHFVCTIHEMHDSNGFHPTSFGRITFQFSVEAENCLDVMTGKEFFTVCRDEVGNRHIFRDPGNLVGIDGCFHLNAPHRRGTRTQQAFEVQRTGSRAGRFSDKAAAFFVSTGEAGF